MGESLTERCRVREEGLRVVKPLLLGKKEVFLNTEDFLTQPSEEAPANYVPAAAVIRRGRALFGFTGRKECVGGSES